MRIAHTAQLTEEEEYLVQGAGETGRWPAKSTQQDKQTNRHDLSPCGPSPTQRGGGSSYRTSPAPNS